MLARLRIKSNLAYSYDVRGKSPRLRSADRLDARLAAFMGGASDKKAKIFSVFSPACGAFCRPLAGQMPAAQQTAAEGRAQSRPVAAQIAPNVKELLIYQDSVVS